MGSTPVEAAAEAASGAEANSSHLSPCADTADVPEATREAMDEADAMAADPDHVTYKSSESLFAALGL